MKKRLFLLFVLLTVFININGIKKEVGKILSKSFYFPFLYTRNLLLLLTQAEKQSIELSVENQSLREKLSKNAIQNANVIETGGSVAGEILQYTPLGIPEEIWVKIKSPKIENLIDATVVDLHGFLVGRVDTQVGKYIAVKTIYSGSFKVGVESIRPYYTGILRGGKTPLVLYVPVDAEIETGDTLYTSSLSSYAKPYIPVGVVEEYRKDDYNPIFYRAKIEPFFKPFTSRVVLIYGKSKS